MKTKEKSLRVFNDEMTFYLNLDNTPPVLIKLLEDEYKARLAWDWFLESFTREADQ